MNDVFVLQNAEGYFLNKSGEWQDGRDPASLYRTPHKDEAMNQLFEVNSRDITLRLKIVCCEVNHKKIPQLDPSILPAPMNDELLENIETNTSDLLVNESSGTADTAMSIEA